MNSIEFNNAAIQYIKKILIEEIDLKKKKYSDNFNLIFKIFFIDDFKKFDFLSDYFLDEFIEHTKKIFSIYPFNIKLKTRISAKIRSLIKFIVTFLLENNSNSLDRFIDDKILLKIIIALFFRNEQLLIISRLFDTFSAYKKKEIILSEKERQIENDSLYLRNTSENFDNSKTLEINKLDKMKKEIEKKFVENKTVLNNYINENKNKLLLDYRINFLLKLINFNDKIICQTKTMQKNKVISNFLINILDNFNCYSIADVDSIVKYDASKHQIISGDSNIKTTFTVKIIESGYYYKENNIEYIVKKCIVMPIK